MAKTQLQAATDGAARYAAAGMRSTMLNTSGASANASVVMAANYVDGAQAPFNPSTDLTLGIYSAASRTFTPTSIVSAANAVKLTTKLTLGGSSHPLALISIFGRSIDIQASSIAVVTGQDASTYVSGKGNPWLSGMPSGTTCTDFRANPAEMDSAGTASNDQSSPAQISLSTVGIAAGTAMTFDGVTGSSGFGGSTTVTDADGDPGLCVNLGSPVFNDYTYFTSSMNGMSNCHAPINAMMAVFLDDNNPSSTAAPSPLDFGTAASRDFTSLSPQLKQVFFVGDGRRTTGEIQQFIVPAGATRVFIASMDGWQYNDNVGGYNLTIHATQTITSAYAP